MTSPLYRSTAEPLLERIKFHLRALGQWSAHQQWQAFLRGDPLLSHIAARRPQLRWKLQRDYLQVGLPLATKLNWLQEHHAWSLRHLPADDLLRIYEADGLTLARLDLEGVDLRVQLSACERFAKEGEWVLSLRFNRRRVAALSFTLRSHEAAACLHIGCLQGADGSGAQDLIRDATKAMQGLRPKQAVVMLMQTLFGQGLGIQTVLAVSNQSHIYQAATRTRGRVQADYDQFWLELGGQPTAQLFELPAQPAPRKDLSEVPSKHRAQMRRRWALEDDLRNQLLSLAKTWR